MGEADFPGLYFFWASKTIFRYQMQKEEHKSGLSFVQSPRKLHMHYPFFLCRPLQGRMRSAIKVCYCTALGFLNSRVAELTKVLMIIVGEG